MEKRQYHMDDKLVIKSDKDNMQEVLFIVISWIILIPVFFSITDGLLERCVEMGILTLVLGKMALYRWIGLNRVLVMEKTGCTVCFYRYRKFYAWEELAIKRWENYIRYSYLKPFFFTRYEIYYEGVFFSKHPIKKPKWMLPYEFLGLWRPITCFCVNFYPYGITEGHGDYRTQTKKNSILFEPIGRQPEIYPVDKEVFINYMKLWDVEIEGLSMDVENIRWVMR